MLLGRKNESQCRVGAAFSADAKFVVAGNEDNDVLVYDKESGDLVQTLQGVIAIYIYFDCIAVE